MNVIGLIKANNERYVFIYTEEGRSDVLRTLGRFAANEELSFTWYDAALVSNLLRQTPSGVVVRQD